MLDGAVSGVPLPDGVSRWEDRHGVVLTFEEPLDARAVSAALGFRAPVAVSFDVHQDSWWVVEAGGELFDPYNRRIECRELTVGDRGVRPRLTGRPPGDPPGVWCGASSAYDVKVIEAQVGWIHIHAARP